MTGPFSKSESRVLAALRLADDVAIREFEAAGWGDPTPVHFAHGFATIKLCAGVLANRRKPSEIHLYDALQKLVARGLVEKSTVVGMGGGLTLYVRKEQS